MQNAESADGIVSQFEFIFNTEDTEIKTLCPLCFYKYNLFFSFLI